MGGRLVRVSVSCGGLGYLFWPGFWGSLAGAALAWYFSAYFLPVFLAVTAAGFLLCKPAQDAFGVKDPQRFVLDEVFGMMVCLAGIPLEPGWFLAAFLVYRLFDVWKPWLIGRVDRMGHPSAIMWDDLAAAVPAVLIVQGALRLWS